ncbi:anti-sigma factor [Pedobacter nyackensis]|uniref:anti-sigma factor n=1 Tax=Pedobacter nyackensis TaxID=475255 RepID=UPI00292F956C|nr:anti-sigma factor [Pedobacter nyackensis]
MEEGRAYIETGILEEYVAGLLTKEQQREVLAMAAKYPEVKQEIEAIEIALEKYAISKAIQPSDGLKNKIINQISNQSPQINTPVTKPAALEARAEIPADKPVNEIPIVPLHAYEAKIKTLRIALVACIALLAMTLVALFTSRNELDEAKNQIIALNLDKQKFASKASYLEESKTELQKIADMADDPDWKRVKLAGTKMDPKAKMVVYWHVSGQHVMVDNSKMQLPPNDQEHQYQLWALVNGKPVDLGVFDMKPDTNHVLLNMKEITGAQAFAVTLEKRGGSVAPTMDQMIVMGGVSI